MVKEDGTYVSEWAEIEYTNYRGERGTYKIAPKTLYFGFSDYHPGEQWLLLAVAEGKGDRTFAMKDIHSWKPT